MVQKLLILTLDRQGIEMKPTETKVTNVGRTAVVTLVSSIRVEAGSIVPERFTSISSPVGMSLITPELGSTSLPQLPILRPSDFEE